ncbi:hypothetical protein [Candidatus Clostridium stratigraminis]|uniref:Uncharacterized protein n=1 Tax=Candidatus Clostridium stratigraminis TaxID=3381661 RepID=A0ABW8T703_9CLOT
MSYNYEDNEIFDEKDADNELSKDKGLPEYEELYDPEEDVASNMDRGYSFNYDEIDNVFIPFYTCPYFRQQQFPGGNNPPPRPPVGSPGGHPGIPQGGHGGHQGMPSSPPPGFIPPKPHMHGGISPHAIDPGAIMPCRFRFSYIWLRNGNSFWAYITHVGRTSIAGFRWNGRRWIYFGMALRNIESFTCH